MTRFLLASALCLAVASATAAQDAEKIEVLERQITDEKNRHRDCFRQRDVFADVERECETPRLTTLQAELNDAIEAQDRLSDPTWYELGRAGGRRHELDRLADSPYYVAVPVT